MSVTILRRRGLYVKLDRDKADGENVARRSNQFQYTAVVEGSSAFCQPQIEVSSFISLWHQMMQVLWDYLSLLYPNTLKLEKYQISENMTII